MMKPLLSTSLLSAAYMLRLYLNSRSISSPEEQELVTSLEKCLTLAPGSPQFQESLRDCLPRALLMMQQDYHRARQELVCQNELYIRRSECLSEQGIRLIREEPQAEEFYVAGTFRAWLITRQIRALTHTLQTHYPDMELFTFSPHHCPAPEGVCRDCRLLLAVKAPESPTAFTTTL